MDERALLTCSQLRDELFRRHYDHGSSRHRLRTNPTIETPDVAMLTIQNLTKTYRSAQERVTVLRGACLRVDAGESVALTGESGSGKSTLLHLIAGLDRADSGSIRLEGMEVTGLADQGRAALRRGAH